jgi:hypothetical protein
MRKFLIRSAMVLALSVPVAAMSAQSAQPSGDSGNNNTYGAATDRHDDAGKWGLLGLLGLAGLFGLKRADRTIARRTIGPTRPVAPSRLGNDS